LSPVGGGKFCEYCAKVEPSPSREKRGDGKEGTSFLLFQREAPSKKSRGNVCPRMMPFLSTKKSVEAGPRPIRKERAGEGGRREQTVIFPLFGRREGTRQTINLWPRGEKEKRKSRPGQEKKGGGEGGIPISLNKQKEAVYFGPEEREATPD